MEARSTAHTPEEDAVIGQYRDSHPLDDQLARATHAARIAAIARQRRDLDQPISRESARRATAARLAAGAIL